MVIGYIHSINDFQDKINSLFILNKDLLTNLLKQSWKEEDLYEKGCAVNEINYNILSYVYYMLIYLDYTRNLEDNSDILESKFEYSKIRKCLTCNNINVEKIEDVLGLNNIENFGINSMSIEDTNIVESLEDTSNLPTVKGNILQLIEHFKKCKLLIKL